MLESAPQNFVLSRRFDDVDEFSETSRGWDLEIRQLDRGKFEGTLRQILCGPVLISHISFNRRIELRASAQAGTRTFGIHLFQPARWCRTSSSEGDIQSHVGGAEVEVITPPGYGTYTVTVTEDFFDKTCEQVGTSKLVDLCGKTGVFSCHPLQLRKLYSALHKYSNSITKYKKLGRLPTGNMGSTPQDFLRDLCSVLDHTNLSTIRPDSTRRGKAVKRAMDYIASYADEPPTIQDLCRAAGVSERTLYYAFLEEFGTTPIAYTRAYRLNAARKALRRAEPSFGKIADVAGYWGFWHMGQFAADYRKMFGELPSQTLQMSAATTAESTLADLGLINRID